MKKNIFIILAVGLFLGIAIPAYAAPDSATYTYDKLGRLIFVTYANGTQIGYGYDAQGNRYAIAVICSGSGC